MPFAFHRLTVPSYFGGLPAGYDYINNAISGTPAFANDVLAGGPNVGSYFVGFGDDGTSADANRPAKALAANTDFLDNLMRADLVQMVRTGDTTVGGSPQTSITLTGTGTIWLGSGGYTFQDLFHIVDSTERDIEVSGTKVVVSGISAGGTLGTGFASGSVTLTLNVGIPVGVTFRMYFCQRTNLATLPIDALTLPFMRNSDGVDGTVVDFVNQVSNPHTLGSAVAGLQAYRFQGPDGTRLAKNATLYFDCDPNDSGATVRQFKWTTRQASVDRVMAALYDDPTSSLFAGLTGMLQVDDGAAYSSLGTFLFQDVNLSTAGSSLHKTWGLTSTNAAFGDQFPRIFDVPVTFNLRGAQAPSLLNYVNGRWETTCGDGTVSFGDFSGPQSIHAAIVYAASVGVGVTNLNIKLKQGTYNFTTFCNLPVGDVVIEGVSPSQTILQGNVGGILVNGMFNIPTGGRLWLKGVSMQYVSGQIYGVYGGAGAGSLFMEDVELVDMTAYMLNPATYKNIAAVYCRSCRFNPQTAGRIGVDLQFGDNNAVLHNGFYFDSCSWFCPDETQTIRIIAADNTHFATITRLLFNRCSYTLGGTATTASHLTHNTGVLEINPNGGNNLLAIFDVTWVDCYPTVATSATNSVLARVYPIALGDNSAGHLALLGRLTIRGGRWVGNITNVPSAISPFLLCANEIVVDDVIFNSCVGTSGGPSSEDQYIVDLTSHSAFEWAQFIFAPGGNAVTSSATATIDQRLDMRSVTFRNFESLSNSGDVWMYLSGTVHVDGVQFCDYRSAGTGTVPFSRLRITPLGQVDGAIKNVTFMGPNGITPVNWVDPTRGVGGIVVLMATPVGTTSRALPIERLCISNFLSTNFDDGILLYNPTTLGSSYSWPYSLIDCSVTGGERGVALYGHGTALSGGNNCFLDCFSIIRGAYGLMQGSGIRLFPDFMGLVLLDGVRTASNGSYGLSVNPNSWNAGTRASMITVVNCHFADNAGTNGQAQFISGTVGEEPRITLKGNSCVLAGVVDKIQIQHSNNLVLPSPATPGGAIFIWGAETGVVGGGNSMQYGNNNLMVENSAYLITP